MKIFWQIAFAAALIYILFMTVCNGNGSSGHDLTLLNDSLLNKVKQDSIKRKRDSALMQARVIELQKLVNDQKQKVTNTEIRLYQSQGTINRLADQLIEAKKLPFDSSFVYVAPSYVDACDSIGVEAKKQGDLLKEAKNNYADLIDLMNYEVVLRDSMIEIERNNLLALRSDFNAQTHFFELAVKAGKKRTKVYGGISALGNPNQPLKGGDIDFTLFDKKGNGFLLGAGFVSNKYNPPNGISVDVTDYYLKAGYKKLITFRK